MRLERLIFENYRQYSGRSELEFAVPGSRNVTLIRGLNGAGKTHLLEALRWCLYGGTGIDELRDAVSKGKLASCSPDETFDMAIELFLEHEGRRYRARRYARVKTHAPIPDGGISFSVQNEVFDLYEIEVNGNAREVSAPRDEVTSMLPREAAEYFFFDGEQIDRFARPDNAIGIQQAVNQVLKFAYLDRAIAHTRDVRQDYETDLRRLAAGTEIEGLLQQKLTSEAERSRVTTEMGAIPEDIARIEAQKAIVENALLEMEAVRERMIRRQELRGILQALSVQASSHLDRISALMPTAHLAFGRGALARTLDLANAKRKKGEIPGRVRQVVVKDLLEAHLCICGRPLEPGTEHFETVRQLGEKSVSSRLEERVIAAATTLPALVRRGEADEQKVREAVGDYHRVTKEMRAVQESLTELDEELRSSRQEEIKDLVDRNRRHEKDLQTLVVRRQDLTRDLAELDRALATLDGQIEKARHQSAQVDAVRRRVVVASSAEQALVETRERFANEVRARVEAGTSEMFKALVWKESHFDRVAISDDFGLSVIDRWGEPALGDLSAGETEVLSLSFIVTMGRVAGESIDARAPVVIDSPFGRLSMEPRENIATLLPGLVDQLVLLVTDTELMATEEAISSRVGRRYDLRFDAETSSTRAVEVATYD